MSIRRLICKLFGHRWDRHDLSGYMLGQLRGCDRCHQLQQVQQICDDGFAWRDFPRAWTPRTRG